MAVSVVATLSCVEGVSSLALFAWDASRPSPPVAESLHTHYDPLLGWSSVPNRDVPDMYGPGVYLRTEAHGFRKNAEVTARVPAGLVRAICSGDSFTLGYGVDNDNTWCQLLEDEDARLDTVNMGVGGYGVDQAYLAYQRDAQGIEHQLQLFAFITTDFKRMRSSEFLGYAKPTLALEQGKLVVRNVPVPQRAPKEGPLAQLLAPLRGLRTSQLVDRMEESAGGACKLGPLPDAAHWPLVAAIFEADRDLNRARGSQLALVYLPTRGDYATKCADPWRDALRAEAARAGIGFVDLVPPFRRLPESVVDPMFIGKGALDFRGATGHYSVAGNRWVARELHAQLVASGLLPSADAHPGDRTAHNADAATTAGARVSLLAAPIARDGGSAQLRARARGRAAPAGASSLRSTPAARATAS